jgi:hypothetical protein
MNVKKALKIIRKCLIKHSFADNAKNNKIGRIAERQDRGRISEQG